MAHAAPRAASYADVRPLVRRPPVVRRALQVLLGGAALLVIVLPLTSQLTAAQPQQVLGHPVLTVLSGSMSPTVRTGDLVVDHAVGGPTRARLAVGDVITFRASAGSSRLFTHRIVEVRRDARGAVSYVTRGDANDAPDAAVTPASDVVGKLWFRVPAAGYVVSALANPWADLLVGVAVGLSGLAARLLQAAGRRRPL